MKHISIRISGKVQGVFFRASTHEKAAALGVKGIVRNESDGSVYVEAEADEKTLDEFLQWCKQGPPRARVDSCEVKAGELKNYIDFRVVK